jgi:hypothetical protein
MSNAKSPQEELTESVSAGPNPYRRRFVGHGVYLESMVLIASMRHAAEELHDRAARSHAFLVKSELFFAELSKTAHANGPVVGRSN